MVLFLFATHLPDATWSILVLLPANERIDDEDVEVFKPCANAAADDDGDDNGEDVAAAVVAFGDAAFIVRCTFCLRLCIRSRFHCGISGRNEGDRLPALLSPGEMLP